MIPMTADQSVLLKAIVKGLAGRFIGGRKLFVGPKAGILATDFEGYGDVLVDDAMEGLFDRRLVMSDGERVWLTHQGEDQARIRWPEYFATMTVYEQVKRTFPPEFLPDWPEKK